MEIITIESSSSDEESNSSNIVYEPMEGFESISSDKFIQLNRTDKIVQKSLFEFNLNERNWNESDRKLFFNSISSQSKRDPFSVSKKVFGKSLGQISKRIYQLNYLQSRIKFKEK